MKKYNTNVEKKQIVKNAIAKSNYAFQMLSKVYNQSIAPEGNALVSFYSIDSNNIKTLLKELNVGNMS